MTDQSEHRTQPSDELAYLSATEIIGRIRRRQVSAKEVMQAFIERIEQRNPSLGAFVYTDFEQALQAAEAADKKLQSGEQLGLLHGLPTAIKDLFGFHPGWPETMGGIPALKDYRTELKGAWAQRVEQAGGIIIGKTNSPVLGFRGTCDNPLFGPTRNPFDTTRNSGGSSGGGAAAVADGMLPFAEGTDGGGSARIPAAWCGIYGFKQSFGRVPLIVRPDAFAGAYPFIFESIMTRTVEDAALWLEAVAGHDPIDPFSVPKNEDFLAATRRSICGLKIGWSPSFGGYPVDPVVRDTVATAVAAFEDLGAHVEEIDYRLPRDQRELSDLWCRLIAPLSVNILEGLRINDGIDVLGESPDNIPQALRDWMELCKGQSISERAQDQAMRSEVLDSFNPVFQKYDLMITPTLASMPVKNTAEAGQTVGPDVIEGVEVDPLIGWCLTYLQNFTGNPAASIPAGLAQGLPVGMQIIGRRWDDATVLAASAAYERARPWQTSYDACARRSVSHS